MIGVSLTELTLKHKRPAWKFPRHAFIEFDKQDEERALRLGWSVWGGERMEVEATWKVKGAAVDITPSSQVTFNCYRGRGLVWVKELTGKERCAVICPSGGRTTGEKIFFGEPPVAGPEQQPAARWASRRQTVTAI